MAYILGDCGAKLFVTSAAKTNVAAELLGSTAGGLHRYMANGSADGYECWEAAVAAQPAEPVPDETEGQDMLYSSGTTGRPKGVKVPLREVPYGTAREFLRLVTAACGQDENSIFLSPAPIYHAAPLRFLLAMQRIGATGVVTERFDAEETLRVIETYQCTHSLWVPTMFVRMLKLPDEVRRRYDVSSLESAVHGAAPCPIRVKEQMIDWWGPVVTEYYGATEANGLCLISSAEWLRRKGSVGKAVMGVPHVLDDDHNELPPGEIGTVFFSDGYEFAYHNDPAKTAEARDARGWTTVGDIGYLDEEGYLYLTDRKAYTIISGGVNIYPQEVEDLLITHHKVMDAAVIGVPNEDLGEEVKAVVQPIDMAETGPALEEELMTFCTATLSHLKCPRSIDFQAALPRQPNGKLYKRLLKDAYWGKRDSRIV